MKTQIIILGSTGSIGKSLINILEKDKKNFEVVLLAVNKNTKELSKQVTKFNVKNVVISNLTHFLKFKKKFKNRNINIFNDFESLNEILKKKKN